MGNNLQVICNDNIPLYPYIENMMPMRKAFRDIVPPLGFYLAYERPYDIKAGNYVLYARP